VLFLVLYKDHPFLAGLSLSVCAIKPHLLLPFGIALCLWLVVRKQTWIVLGALTGTLATSLIATAVRPSIWSDYLSMLRTAQLDQEFYPTASALLRLAIHPRWAWLQALPAVVACIWAAWYYLRNRNDWAWTGAYGYLLILVSLLVTPRGWVTDEILAVPALLFLFYEGSSRIVLRCLAAASLVAMGEMFAGVKITGPFYIWTTTAWLACYVAAMPVSAEGSVSTAPQLVSSVAD